MRVHRTAVTRSELLVVMAIIAVFAVLAVGVWKAYVRYFPKSARDDMAVPHVKPSFRISESSGETRPTNSGWTLAFRRRGVIDSSGYAVVGPSLQPWEPHASLEQISETWRQAGYKLIARFAGYMEHIRSSGDRGQLVALLMTKAMLFNYEGETNRAYEVLEEVRSLVEADYRAAHESLYTIIYLQGITALRRGENDNCIMCRGESSCILPIAPAAVHTKPEGSRLAIQHFTEYLWQFPRRSGRPLAAQPGPHDSGRISREGRSPVPRLAGSISKLGIRHRQVSRRQPPGACRSIQPGWRGDHERLRQRRLA
jgi:hypothetical protein